MPLKESLLNRDALSGAGNIEIPTEIVVLVKPQFEVGKGEVGKGGIVRDEAKRIRALEAIEAFSREAGYQVVGNIPSPITGAEGNQEFLMYLRLGKGLLSKS